MLLAPKVFHKNQTSSVGMRRGLNRLLACSYEGVPILSGSYRVDIACKCYENYSRC